ncbi:MAG: IS1182 family transposase, partial [Armatimonadota bacterium]|nr:IS1182 family transposase [Armatimonadota bacterium]
EGHLSYFVSDTIDEMDLWDIEGEYEKSLAGYPPYHPHMMTKILFYAYCTGVYSSRKIAKKLEDDVAFRALAAGNHPDFRTISDFRKQHLAALAGMFKQVLTLCRRAGMARLGHVSLDGTKQKANASKHKAMSYGRMKEESARLELEIAQLLAAAEQIDDQEDKELGSDVRGDELPAEFAFRKNRLAKIRQAMSELEADAKAQEALGADDHEGDPPGAESMPAKRGRPRKKPIGVPDDKAQRNFTDPESRIMKAADKSFVQGYNAQAAVDSEYQVIVATMVTNQAADSQRLEDMVARIEENTGQLPDEMSLDAGYYSDTNVEILEKKNIDVYMPPCRLKHREYRDAKPEPVTEQSTTRERMKAKVLTDEGRAKYGLRKETVEPVFGQTKECRGFRRFSMRGQEACEAEWSFVCAAHDLLKLARYGAKAMAQQAARVAVLPKNATPLLVAA